MNNRTYIQEQISYFNEYQENETREERLTRLAEYLDSNKYYFDINNDTNKNSSSDIADSPVDAGRGATLQDKRVINMKTVGLSGKFSARCHNNPSFADSDNRIGIIIRYFEDALAKQKIYTVCRKGAMFYNMMLNKMTVRMGDYCSTVEISLSFIEVNIIEKEVEEDTKMLIVPESYGNIMAGVEKMYYVGSSFGNQEYYYKKYIELYPPKLYLKVDYNPDALNDTTFYVGALNLNEELITPSDIGPTYKTGLTAYATLTYTRRLKSESESQRKQISNTYTLKNIYYKGDVACFKIEIDTTSYNIQDLKLAVMFRANRSEVTIWLTEVENGEETKRRLYIKYTNSKESTLILQQYTHN